MRGLRCVILGVGLVLLSYPAGWASSGTGGPPVVPRTWDAHALATLEVPLAHAPASPVHVAADYYYRIPALTIYKTYPVYRPDREPDGYQEWLKQQEPQIVFNAADLKTEADWVRAGERVFDAPQFFGPPFGTSLDEVRNPAWYEKSGMPVAKDGTLPIVRYVIRKKGQIELGSGLCASCHTRLMPDGSILRGAQGNFPVDRPILAAPRPSTELMASFFRPAMRGFYASPWLQPDPNARLAQASWEEIIALGAAIPGGVMDRHGTSPYFPVQIPDLIGVKDRRYLDSTGLVQQRGIGDLMRYASLNAFNDVFSRYGDFVPIEAYLGKWPEASTVADVFAPRYSDEQLYALAKFLYSLKPPPNPNRPTALTRRGQQVFEREACASCHTPPLYSNNMLTPAQGFPVPEEHMRKYRIYPVSVGTDPKEALLTRRGTGYYKVPSLKGVWYRSMFGHEGACAALEDWFDPRRLRDDYAPTGWKPFDAKSYAVKGHVFGLSLPAADRKALIAFLKTL